MYKKIALLILPFLLISCSGSGPEINNQDYCPVLMIKQDVASALFGSAEVRIKGYDAYCYYNEKTKSTWARITPDFEVVRNGTGDEIDVFFAYYTETLIGPPEYLGKKTRYEKVEIPQGMSYKHFKGKTFEMTIPAGMEYTYGINMGLSLDKKNKI